MTLAEVFDILYRGAALDIPKETMRKEDESSAFLEAFSRDKVIYGINTGFGPMAQWRVDDRHLKELQYNIIRSHSTGAGEPLDGASVRAAMLARLGSFLQGKSGKAANLLINA